MSPKQEPESPITIMSHLYPDMARAFARRVGMSLSRMEVLHELMHADEISQAELARRLDMEGALLTRFVKQMEADGLVTRRVDPTDNRFTLVRLAPAGQAALEKMDALGEAFGSQLLEGLSAAELESLVRAMKRIWGNLARMEQES
jgi:DNA-binding MarR family transcriptional regulator